MSVVRRSVVGTAVGFRSPALERSRWTLGTLLLVCMGWGARALARGEWP